MAIRPYAPADLQAIWAINQANTPAVGSLSLEEMAEVLALSDVALVAEQGPVILGFVVCMHPDSRYASPNFLFFTERYDRFLYIDRVAVEGSARGRGIGRALYSALWTHTPDPLACEVNTVPLNQSSLDFHAAMGFSPVGEGQAKGCTVRYLMRRAPGQVQSGARP